VQASEINVNVTTLDNNGTFSSQTMDLNLEEGRIGAWFIIPANLNVGDQFYDINLARNVTVEGQAQKTYAGALRTVINASTPERIKDWDKATGVFLKSIDTLPGYSINATATKTNIWSPEAQENNYAFVYGFVIVVVIAVAAVVVFAVLRWHTT
jgi:hypothetical protein